MHHDPNQPPPRLAADVLDAYGLLTHGHAEQVAGRLEQLLRRAVALVGDADGGWPIVHLELCEAADVEPRAVALFGAQAVVELAVAGWPHHNQGE